MRFPNELLQIVLNYDTNKDCFLTIWERMAIHRSIAYKIGYGKERDLPPVLSVKIVGALDRIREMSYRPKNMLYKPNRRQ